MSKKEAQNKSRKKDSNAGQEESFFIRRIKDISFSVNERLNDPVKEIEVQLLLELATIEEDNLIGITVRAFLYYPERPQAVLADTYVENLFEVADVKKFITDKGLLIPPDLLVSMLSISITHTRALFAKNLCGTSYEDFILPIVNPVSVAEVFFPDMLKGKPFSDQ